MRLVQRCKDEQTMPLERLAAIRKTPKSLIGS